MLVSYPALFYYEKSGNATFHVTFPDFKETLIEGVDVTDALAKAADWLGTTVANLLENDGAVPTASLLNDVSLANDDTKSDEPSFDPKQSFKSMVLVNLDSYLNGNVKVKKSVAIPKWADRTGAKLNLNLSRTLTEAIAKIKIENDAEKAQR